MAAHDGATLYIDGAWCGADDGASFGVTDPASGQVIGKAADATGRGDDEARVDGVGWARAVRRVRRRGPRPRAAAPFGGTGEAGLGREGGAQGIDEYLDVKLIGHVLP